MAILTSTPIDCKNLAPVWETVATDFINDKNVVIAKVDAEAHNSKQITKAFNVESYPTILFFPAGKKEPIAYEAGRSEKDVLEWINTKAGTHRAVGGGLDVYAGTIAALDTIVAKFTGGGDLAAVTEEIKKEAESLKDTAQYTYAQYYVRVFDKLNKSDGYAAKELARLDGILSKGGLAPTKRDEIQSKTNVLRRFFEEVAEKVGETVEDVKESVENVKEKVGETVEDAKEKVAETVEDVKDEL